MLRNDTTATAAPSSSNGSYQQDRSFERACAGAILPRVGLRLEGSAPHTVLLPFFAAARHGDEGKFVGCGSPAALLFEEVVNISKIKLSISIIAVTPAMESTSASLASL